MRGKRMRRGLYVLPTCFTTGNLFCGFFSVVQTLRGEYGDAAELVIVAGVLDGIDGRIARMTGTTSDFGVEFDSLADVVSFGVAPALLAYAWSLTPFGRFGWLAAFLFLACAAARLARFNIQRSLSDRKFFAGLPSPAAAGAVASVVFAFPESLHDPALSGIAAALVIVVGLLMISKVRYRSFKELDLKNRRPSVWVVPIAAVLAVIFSEPRYVLMILAALYLGSGPVGALVGMLSRSKDRTSEVVGEPLQGDEENGRAPG